MKDQIATVREALECARIKLSRYTEYHATNYIGGVAAEYDSTVKLIDKALSDLPAAPAPDPLRDAAPDLLEALIWMVENDDTNEGDEPLEHLRGRTWNEVNDYWIDGLNKARRAIAKAKGESLNSTVSP